MLPLPPCVSGAARADLASGAVKSPSIWLWKVACWGVDGDVSKLTAEKLARFASMLRVELREKDEGDLVTDFMFCTRDSAFIRASASRSTASMHSDCLE